MRWGPTSLLFSIKYLMMMQSSSSWWVVMSLEMTRMMSCQLPSRFVSWLWKQFQSGRPEKKWKQRENPLFWLEIGSDILIDRSRFDFSEEMREMPLDYQSQLLLVSFKEKFYRFTRDSRVDDKALTHKKLFLRRMGAKRFPSSGWWWWYPLRF